MKPHAPGTSKYLQQITFMKTPCRFRRFVQLLAVGGLLAVACNTNATVIVQGSGSSYVAFEGDTTGTIIAGTPESWVSTNEPTASAGTALYADGTNSTGNSPHSFAQYSVRFATAGTYYLYYRWRADPARTAGDAFTANSFQVANTFGAFSTPGDLTPFHVAASNGGSAPTDNVFDWSREADTAIYTVTPTDVSSATPLIFTIGTREAGMTIDRFVFSTEAALTDAQLDALANSGTTPTAPQLARAVGSAALNAVTVTFTRPLAAASVSAANFAINNGLTVSSATVDIDDARIVQLTTSAQAQGTSYTITVNGVTDTSGTPIAPNSTINFTAWRITAGWALKEIYFGITGTTVADLTAAPNYPAKPDRVQWVKGFQLNQDPLTDNYGARLTAFFNPQTTGNYEFFINDDDEAELQLSTDPSEANLASLGVSPLTAPPFAEPPFATSPGSLTSGQRYLLRGLLKQGGGDVYLNVAARLQGSGTPPASLPVLGGNLISAFVNPDIGNVTFTQQPTNITTTAGSRARFAVKVTANESPIYYQWRANGTDIPGATRSVYTTPVLTTGDSGKTYTCVVSVAGKDTLSSSATLTVGSGVPSNLQPYLGLNFVGGGTFGGDALSNVDVAGVVMQENWNNLNGFAFDPVATPITLVDASGVNTPVTLTATATEVWYTGTRAVGDADGALLQGFINAQALTDPVIFTLNNVPTATYNVLVYSIGFDFTPNYFQGYSVTGSGAYPTYHGKAETGLNFINNPAFRRMVNQTPGSADTGNYVQFDNVSPAADGSLVVSVTWEPADPGISNGHQPAINAIQLIKVLPITQQPTLGATKGAQAGTLTISWPASAAGFRLESSAALGSQASWTTVSGSPNPITGAGSLNVTISGNTQFYRLRQ